MTSFLVRWLSIGFMLGLAFSAVLRTNAFSADASNILMVLYSGANVGGTWGPLPYDMAECEVRAAEWQASIDQILATGIGENGVIIPSEMKSEILTWRMDAKLAMTDRPWVLQSDLTVIRDETPFEFPPADGNSSTDVTSRPLTRIGRGHAGLSSSRL